MAEEVSGDEVLHNVNPNCFLDFVWEEAHYYLHFGPTSLYNYSKLQAMGVFKKKLKKKIEFRPKILGKYNCRIYGNHKLILMVVDKYSFYTIKLVLNMYVAQIYEKH